MLNSWYLCVVALVPVGCEHSQPREQSTGTGAPDVTTLDQKSWDEYAGKTVQVKGVARYAKVGPIVLLDNEHPVYIDGLDKWPTEFSDKSVVVTGRLIRHPEQAPPENGAAYIRGPYYSLASATWSLAK
jgi:hypothetical protein